MTCFHDRHNVLIRKKRIMRTLCSVGIFRRRKREEYYEKERGGKIGNGILTGAKPSGGVVSTHKSNMVNSQR